MQTSHAVPLGEMFSSLAQWPFQCLTGVLARHSMALRQLSTLVERPTPDAASGLVLALWDWRCTAAGAPFDASARELKAMAAQGLGDSAEKHSTRVADEDLIHRLRFRRLG